MSVIIDEICMLDGYDKDMLLKSNLKWKMLVCETTLRETSSGLKNGRGLWYHKEGNRPL